MGMFNAREYQSKIGKDDGFEVIDWPPAGLPALPSFTYKICSRDDCRFGGR
jgi:hypothetical protein